MMWDVKEKCIPKNNNKTQNKKNNQPKGKAKANARRARGAPVARNAINRTNKPRYLKQSPGGVTISHKEYLGDIVASGDFSLQRHFLNPGNAGTFPWLSKLATRYEHYRFLNVGLIFSGSAPSTMGGKVYLGYEFDAKDALPANKRELLVSTGAKSVPTWMESRMALPKQGLSRQKRYFVSSVESDDAERGNGYAYACTEGLAAQAGQTLGELWVHYTVELTQPDDSADSSSAKQFSRKRPGKKDITSYTDTMAQAAEPIGGLGVEMKDPKLVDTNGLVEESDLKTAAGVDATDPAWAQKTYSADAMLAPETKVPGSADGWKYSHLVAPMFELEWKEAGEFMVDVTVEFTGMNVHDTTGVMNTQTGVLLGLHLNMDNANQCTILDCGAEFLSAEAESLGPDFVSALSLRAKVKVDETGTSNFIGLPPSHSSSYYFPVDLGFLSGYNVTITRVPFAISGPSRQAGINNLPTDAQVTLIDSSSNVTSHGPTYSDISDSTGTITAAFKQAGKFIMDVATIGGRVRDFIMSITGGKGTVTRYGDPRIEASEYWPEPVQAQSYIVELEDDASLHLAADAGVGIEDVCMALVPFGALAMTASCANAARQLAYNLKSEALSPGSYGQFIMHNDREGYAEANPVSKRVAVGTMEIKPVARAGGTSHADLGIIPLPVDAKATNEPTSLAASIYTLNHYAASGKFSKADLFPVATFLEDSRMSEGYGNATVGTRAAARGSGANFLRILNPDVPHTLFAATSDAAHGVTGGNRVFDLYIVEDGTPAGPVTPEFQVYGGTLAATGTRMITLNLFTIPPRSSTSVDVYEVELREWGTSPSAITNAEALFVYLTPGIAPVRSRLVI